MDNYFIFLVKSNQRVIYNETSNNKTNIFNKRHNYQKLIRIRASNNVETDISKPEHNCQNNIHVLAPCEYKLICLFTTPGNENYILYIKNV